MALDTKLQGGNDTPNEPNVDAEFNLMTNSPGNTSAGVPRGGGNAEAGSTTILSENDPGTATGARSVKSPKTSLHRRLRVGIDTLLFNDTFNATTQNTSLWEYVFVVMTASQPGAGTLNFGTVQGTAITHGAFMRTYQHFPLVGKASTTVKFSCGQFTAALVANEEYRCGFARPTVAGTAPVDGVWFKLTTAGLFGEIAYNGVVTPTGALATLASFALGEICVLEIIVGEQTTEFWRDGILLGSLENPVSNGQPYMQSALPLFIQKLCTGNVTNTNTVRVADINVYLSDIASNKDWSSILSTLGQNGNLGQNGHTQGKNTLYANSAAATAAAASNTTPPFFGLGGQVAILPSASVSVDGIIISYTNPAPTVNITGRNLLIYGVTISSHVSVVFSASALITYQASMQYGHTADSLATAETGSFVTATTHAPRVVPLGTINYRGPANTIAVASPAGTVGDLIDRKWAVPFIVRPGERVAIVMKLGVGGVVTATGAITFMINYDSVWE